MNKFNVTIEQPLCKTFEVEAKDIDEALEIGRKNWHNETFVLNNDDIGTDAQIMAEAEDGSECVDWSNL